MPASKVQGVSFWPVVGWKKEGGVGIVLVEAEVPGGEVLWRAFEWRPPTSISPSHRWRYQDAFPRFAFDFCQVRVSSSWISSKAISVVCPGRIRPETARG
ncbi:hypothetical protein KM043_014279 [Ampulex compressa]|nr:hypothetical protein KM043_014279 [Ampulex compressa]